MQKFLLATESLTLDVPAIIRPSVLPGVGIFQFLQSRLERLKKFESRPVPSDNLSLEGVP